MSAVAAASACCCGAPAEPCALCLIPPFAVVNYPSPPSAVAISGWFKTTAAIIVGAQSGATNTITVPCGHLYTVPGGFQSAPRQPNSNPGNKCNWSKSWDAASAPFIETIGTLNVVVGAPPNQTTVQVSVDAALASIYAGAGAIINDPPRVVVSVGYRYANAQTGVIGWDMAGTSIVSANGLASKTCVQPASIFGAYSLSSNLCGGGVQQVASFTVS